jgi:electron transfer flavoprotein beta subunit
MIAELLHLPQVTVAVKVKVGGNRPPSSARSGGREPGDALPAVVSAQKGLNEPRYASLKGIMAAKKKPIQVLDLAGLGLDAASVAPKVKVTAMELPPARPAVRMIEGDPEAQAKELVRLLHEEAKVI